MGGLILTCEQLYFLGEILKAKYIDYRYIKAMPDIQKQYTYLKNKSISALLRAGILQEDFTGNLKVLPAYEALFSPIFLERKKPVWRLPTDGLICSIKRGRYGQL